MSIKEYANNQHVTDWITRNMNAKELSEEFRDWLLRNQDFGCAVQELR
jgi:hypothetical protein